MKLSEAMIALINGERERDVLLASHDLKRLDYTATEFEI